jgi:hypothetical protein
MDKVDWLDACIALRMVGTVFSSGVGEKFAQSSTNGKQGPIPGSYCRTRLDRPESGLVG